MAYRKKYNKFHNIKTEVDGITFHSKAEATHYLLLKAREEVGEIDELKLQFKFKLSVNDQHITTYIADFVYFEKGVLKVIDVKSPQTAKEPYYILKRKLMKACLGIEITEVI